MPPTEPPIEMLTRWEEHGATWRAVSITETDAVVELCTCYGETVDQLRSDDPALLHYLAQRPRSEMDPPSISSFLRLKRDDLRDQRALHRHEGHLLR
jgi:hypothetical protein